MEGRGAARVVQSESCPLRCALEGMAPAVYTACLQRVKHVDVALCVSLQAGHSEERILPFWQAEWPALISLSSNRGSAKFYFEGPKQHKKASSVLCTAAESEGCLNRDFSWLPSASVVRRNTTRNRVCVGGQPNCMENPP